MAIAHDAQTRFPSGATSEDTTTGDRTFTHTPSGTPKGAVVVISVLGTTAPVAGVLYGGTGMTLSADSQDTSEAGRVQIYTLTDLSALTGQQTITLQTCIAAAKFVTCSTVTATASQTRVNATTSKNTTTGTNPTVSTTTTRNTCSYGGLHTGNNSVGTAGTGTTLQHDRDYGTLCGQTCRRTSNDEASGTITLNITIGASEDYCFSMVSLAEQFVIDAQPGSYAETGIVTELVGPSYPPPDVYMARFRS